MYKKKRLNIFVVIYYTILSIAYILAIPFLFLLSFKKKYKDSIPKRFFPFNNNSFDNNSIWFHSCSLGETKALKPLIDKLNTDVNISVVTNTGFEEATKLSKNVRFLPFEIFLPFWIKKQNKLIVMEAELWYMLFFVAKRKDINTILINARISDKSYNKYLKFRFLYKNIFGNIDKVFAQSDIDKQRLESLGAKNVEVVGNIKTFSKIDVTTIYDKPNDLVITAGSTHKNEEELILDAYLKLNKNYKLIIVPRHPERFDEVDLLIKSKISTKTYHRFSQNKNFDSDIILVDMMGELINIYAISDIVILGGAFENIGGHNPIEPAYFNCKIISGENYFNQKELFKAVDNISITNNNKILDTIQDVIDNGKKSKTNSTLEINKIIDYIKNN
jgi:3-deoxy-D-manno-octulosonic-acid transferase